MLPYLPLHPLGTKSCWILKYLPKLLLFCHSLMFLMVEGKLEGGLLQPPGHDLLGADGDAGLK